MDRVRAITRKLLPAAALVAVLLVMLGAPRERAGGH